MTTFRVIWIGLFVLALTTDSTETAATIDRWLLLQEAMAASNYEPTLHPNFATGDVTNVSVQITVRDMYAVSETNMDYSLDIYLRQRWVDSRLAHNIEALPKIELDASTMSRLWLPDTHFMNEKKASLHTVTTPNKMLHLFKNGTVVYSMRIAVTLGCNMDLYLYPFDIQKCRIKMNSFAYSKESINLNWHKPEGFIIEEQELPQFTLDPHSALTDYDHEFPTGLFSTLSVSLTISRNVGHYFLSVFLPSGLLVMLSWVSFWVDPKAVPARVSLGVTCILTMTTQSSGNRQTLPPVSYVKMIDIWMFTCLVFVFAALLEFAYVNVLLRSKIVTEDMSFPDSKGIERAKRVDNMAKLLFPFVFALFLILFSFACFWSRSADYYSNN